MKTAAFLLGAALILLTIGCQTHSDSTGNSHDMVGGTDDHSHNLEVLKITEFSNNYELYVEFEPLIVNKKSTFAAHLTRLENYNPVSVGIFTVSLIKDGKGIRHTVEAPSAPGTFNPALLPKEAGVYRLVFLFENTEESVEFSINKIEVFADDTSASNSITISENPDEITFFKDQAWKSEFETYLIERKTFHTVIHTSGKVKYHPSSEINLNAQSDGLLNLTATLGESVTRGDMLAYISGAGLENDFTVKLSTYRLAFEKSKTDYHRIRPLIDSQTISQKEFLEIKSKYQNDSIHYHQFAKNITAQGLKITAPIDGYVSRVIRENGAYVESGEGILTVSNSKSLIIETYVNQSDYKEVSSVFDANFRLPDSETTLTLNEINGKLRSANTFVGSSSSRIPVTFSVNNSDNLIPGMFLEAFLFSGRKENAIVIPLSGITEEQGLYYVYVQLGGETYSKREIQIANNDGVYTEVISGLEPGERIVSKGAYQIKLAAMSGDLPIHGHTH